jgi:hypothetical protein
MTPDFDFVIDTRMPLTIGPCVFLDLPCEALHDMQLIPSPRLQHWVTCRGVALRLDAVQLGPHYGLFTFRAIDSTRPSRSWSR